MKYLNYLSAISLVVSSVILVGLQNSFGWFIFLFGIIITLLTENKFKKYFLLLYFSLFLLSITSISTDVTYSNIFEMSFLLGLAVLFPYLVSKYLYKENEITFKFHHGRKWFKKEVGYIFFTILIAYFLIPFYLINSNAYTNWTVESGFSNIFRLFIGTNGLGIWDELFFVSTVLGVMRMFFPFQIANIFQSVMFTSFLYELGFTGWGPLMIFPFAWIQGLVFKKTDSLFYVITIHLSLDLILFLALIYSHHPTWLPIFIT